MSSILVLYSHRLTVNDQHKVNQARLKEIGARRSVRGGGNFQVVFGTESDLLKEGNTWKKWWNSLTIQCFSPPWKEVSFLLIRFGWNVFSKNDGWRSVLWPNRGKVFSPCDARWSPLFFKQIMLWPLRLTANEVLVRRYWYSQNEWRVQGFVNNAVTMLSVDNSLIRFDPQKMKSQIIWLLLLLQTVATPKVRIVDPSPSVGTPCK